jgi:hypothetical protein
MKAFFANLKDKALIPLLATAAFIGAVLFVLRQFFGGSSSSDTPVSSDEFPQAEKKKAKAELKELQKEEKAIEKKQFSDKELDDIFNKKG